MPVDTVNFQAGQFHRFDRSQPTWVYVSPGIDLNFIASLRDHWTFDQCVAPK